MYAHVCIEHSKIIRDGLIDSLTDFEIRQSISVRRKCRAAYKVNLQSQHLKKIHTKKFQTKLRSGKNSFRPTKVLSSGEKIDNDEFFV